MFEIILRNELSMDFSFQDNTASVDLKKKLNQFNEPLSNGVSSIIAYLAYAGHHHVGKSTFFQ